MKQGFTLIELLIVVAIIGILAAVAVPNFINAMLRSQISRAQADQRSLATALETYAIDHNHYPSYGNPNDFTLFAGEPIVFVPVSITTPVAYMSSLPPDVFPGKRTGLEEKKNNTYFYMHNYQTEYLGKQQSKGHVRDHYRSLTGEDKRMIWTLWSYGPDLDDDHGIMFYDASNGLASSGDMMRFGP